MPTIPGYRQQEKSGVGVQTPRVFDERARAVGSAMSALGGALQHTGAEIEATNERTDKLRIQADVAQARSDLTTELRNDVQSGAVTADDYHTVFKDKVASRLSTLGEGRLSNSGRDISSTYAQVLSAEFQEHASQAKLVADGQQAVAKFGEALNYNRNTVMGDPTQFQTILEDTQRTLGDPSGPYGRMPSEARAKLMTQTKEQLALSAVQGSIETFGPQYTKDQLQKGNWDTYLDADRKVSMIAAADQAIRMQDAEAARIDAQRDREERRRDKALMQDYVTRVIDPNTPDEKQVTMAEIAKSGLSAAAKEHMASMVIAQAKDPDYGRQSDRAVVRDLQDRIFAADGAPDKIYDAREIDKLYPKSLNRTDLLRLRMDFNAQQNDASGFHRNSGLASKTAYNLFTKNIANLPDVAEDAYYRWRKDFDTSVQVMQEKGEDPRQLLDPKSKSYALDPERLAKYSTEARQAFGAAATRMKALGEVSALETAKSGDTVTYNGRKLKRTEEPLRVNGAINPKAFEEQK